MIILIGWPLMFCIIGAVVLFVGASSTVYGISSTWKKDIPWCKNYTVGQKWGLFALLLAILASIASFIYGFFGNNGTFGLVGLLVWISMSLLAAYGTMQRQLPFLRNLRESNIRMQKNNAKKHTIFRHTDTKQKLAI